MEALFLKIVNMSITASWLVLAIIAVRLIFKKTPKWTICLLWGLVALRLIFPFSIESALSLIPNPEPLPQEIIYTAHPEIQSDVSIIDNTVNPILESSMTPVELVSANPTQIWSFVLSQIWILGMVLMLLYTLISYLLLKGKVATAIPLKKGIKCSEYVDSPFVLGVIHPVIYLPFGMEEADIAYVIAHEKAHIRRKDHWWKPIGFLLLSIYWFNPVLWVAYILLCRDIEAACDEKVIRDMNRAERRAYSTALLNCSVHRRRIAACPLAFGETGVKARVKSVMNYKKPAIWMVLVVLLVSAVVAVCFLTDPKEEPTLEDMTRTAGPATVGVGNLYFSIPEGFAIEMRESEVQPDGELPQYEHRLLKGDEIVGGVYKLEYPDSNWADYWTWVEDLNVPENVPEERFLMSVETRGQFKGYPYSMAAFYGKEGIEETVHYFFNGDSFVYDLWLSMEQLTEDERNLILDSLQFEKSSWDGTMKLLLPDGLDFSRDIQGNLIFTDGLNMVGGKRVYKIPDGYELNEYFSQEFLAALGIPEASNETLGYFGGGAILGPEGYGMEYFSDVPPGQTRDIHTHHQFFVMDDGETVYDIWLDLRFVDSAVKDSILGSIEILDIMLGAATVDSGTNAEPAEEVAVTETVRPAMNDEQSALAQCRAVLDQVQNSAAYKIDTMQENGASALNEMSMITDWGYEENRLHMAWIPESGGISVVGGMVMDGQRYSYDLVQQWRKSEDYDWSDPWLVGFRWEDDIVAYMDTLTEESGITVLLRIDEPYKEGPDQQPCYFVNFNFEPDGTFRNVYVQTNLFTDNAEYKTESILNLNTEVVQREIQAEFNSITK